MKGWSIVFRNSSDTMAGVNPVVSTVGMIHEALLQKISILENLKRVKM